MGCEELGEYVRRVCGWRVDERIGFGLYQSCGNRGECRTCVCVLVAVVWVVEVGSG